MSEFLNEESKLNFEVIDVNYNSDRKNAGTPTGFRPSDMADQEQEAQAISEMRKKDSELLQLGEEIDVPGGSSNANSSAAGSKQKRSRKERMKAKAKLDGKEPPKKDKMATDDPIKASLKD